MTDKIYQDLMKGLKTNNNVKRCCSMEGLYEKLKDINQKLQKKVLMIIWKKARSISQILFYIKCPIFRNLISDERYIKSQR